MSERELREQLKVTKRMLEMNHGRALEYGTSEEAEAYYDAIKDIDTALVKNWKTDSSPEGLAKRWIEKSRAARREGYKTATKYEERRERRRQKHQPKSFWENSGPLLFYREVKQTLSRWLK